MNMNKDIKNLEDAYSKIIKESLGSGLECPDCQSELEHDDTFGNTDHCLNSIGQPRSEGSRERHPVKAGDIYRCHNCEEYWHTYDGNDELISGYPC